MKVRLILKMVQGHHEGRGSRRVTLEEGCEVIDAKTRKSAGHAGKCCRAVISGA